VASISADIFGSFGGSGLSNSFEKLWLQNEQGNILDEVAGCLNDQGAYRWCAGVASPEFISMERISSAGLGTDTSNWGSNTGLITTGNDALGGPLRGTPKFKNSVSQ
jgi:hypothetical protein